MAMFCGSECVSQSAPTGIRTPVLALKGPRPSPLDDGGAGKIVSRAAGQGQRYALRRLRGVPLKAGAVMAWMRHKRRSSKRDLKRGSISSNASAVVTTVG